MIDRNSLDALIKKHNLSQFHDAILRAARPSMRMKAQPASANDIPLGDTKIGGTPDFPPGMAYPVESTVTLPFVAQVNLAQVQPVLSGYPALPQQGILYFFYEDDLPPEVSEGREYHIYWLARTLYHPGDARSLTRVEPPATLRRTAYRPCRIDFEQELTLPGLETQFAMKQLHISWENYKNPVAETFLAFIDEYYGNRYSTTHRFMGYPDPIQYDVFYDAETLPTWKETGTPVHNRPHFADWMLILQIDSEDAADMMWGDDGRLYFCIKRPDWETRRFDNMVGVMQCG